MQATQVGKRYAKALYALAQEKGSLDAVSNDMEQLQRLLEDSRDFEVFCGNPFVAASERMKVFNSLFGNGADALTLRFLEFLDRKDRLSSLGAICVSFSHLYREAKGILLAEVTFSHEPSEAQVEALKQKLAAKTGKTIQAETRVDASLIGGFRINIDNEISDYSVSTQLEHFRQQAINA